MVIGADDPSEHAGGRGPGILRDEGVEVAHADGRRGRRGAARQPGLSQARAHRPAAGHPEGRAQPRRADRRGPRATRAGSPGRRVASSCTAGGREADAVAVGIGTALADDPLLTVRDVEPPPRRPARVVFDSGARLPVGSRLVETVAEAPVIVLAAAGAPADRIAALREAGVECRRAGGRSRGPDRGRARGARPSRDRLAAGRGGRRRWRGRCSRPRRSTSCASSSRRCCSVPGRRCSPGRPAARSGEAERPLSCAWERSGDDILVRARLREW